MVNNIERYLEQIRRLIDEELLSRYQALPLREQRLVVLLALFLAVTLPVFGVIMPLNQQRQQAQADLATLRIESAQAERMADLLQSGNRRGADGNIMADVDRIARSSGVRQFMTRIRPQAGIGEGRALSVQIKSAPYAKIVSFMAALNDKGYAVSQLKLRADETEGFAHMSGVIGG